MTEALSLSAVVRLIEQWGPVTTALAVVLIVILRGEFTFRYPRKRASRGRP